MKANHMRKIFLFFLTSTLVSQICGCIDVNLKGLDLSPVRSAALSIDRTNFLLDKHSTQWQALLKELVEDLKKYGREDMSDLVNRNLEHLVANLGDELLDDRITNGWAVARSRIRKNSAGSCPNSHEFGYGQLLRDLRNGHLDFLDYTEARMRTILLFLLEIMLQADKISEKEGEAKAAQFIRAELRKGPPPPDPFIRKVDPSFLRIRWEGGWEAPKRFLQDEGKITLHGSQWSAPQKMVQMLC